MFRMRYPLQIGHGRNLIHKKKHLSNTNISVLKNTFKISRKGKRPPKSQSETSRKKKFRLESDEKQVKEGSKIVAGIYNKIGLKSNAASTQI